MNTVQVDGLEQNSKLALVANKYHYLVWFILGLTVIAIGLSIISNSSNNNGDSISNSVIVIVCLLVLYFSATWFSRSTI